MSAPLTAKERSQRARLAAYSMHARNNSTEVTAEARRRGPGNIEYWLSEVDPDSSLSERDRRRRAESAKRAYFLRLSYRGAQARKRNAAARRDSGTETVTS